MSKLLACVVDMFIQLFPDPDEFRPERFLGPDTVPTFTAGFGFGRRQCAGMHIAINSLFILVSK
jgi:cytochrome P450